MNKEEILKKSRKENEGKPDECELQVIANGSRYGIVVGGILSLIITLFAHHTNQPLLSCSAFMIFFSMYGTSTAYDYAKTKKKLSLVRAISGILCFVLYLISAIKLWMQL